MSGKSNKPGFSREYSPGGWSKSSTHVQKTPPEFRACFTDAQGQRSCVAYEGYAAFFGSSPGGTSGAMASTAGIAFSHENQNKKVEVTGRGSLGFTHGEGQTSLGVGVASVSVTDKRSQK